jgi:hypothetical protein
VLPKKIAAARQTIDGEDDALQEARTRFSHGDYVAATGAANATAAKLRGSTADLVVSAPPPAKSPRRGR